MSICFSNEHSYYCRTLQMLQRRYDQTPLSLCFSLNVWKLEWNPVQNNDTF